MASNGSKANQRRIQEDEAELRRLMGQSEETEVKRVKAAPTEEEYEEEPEVEVTEDKPKAKSEDSGVEGYEKRYKDAQRYITRLNKRIAELEVAQKKAVQLPKSDEELDEWMKKFPDVAAIVRSIAMKESTPVREQIEELERNMQKAKTEAAVLKAHPDYHDIVDDPKFHDWAEGLSHTLQSAIYDSVDRPQDVIHIIKMYKLETGKTEDEKEDKPDRKAASSTKPRRSSSEPDKDGGRRGRVYRESEIRAMNIREYERNYDNIMKARQEGRVEYDLSGGAR